MRVILITGSDTGIGKTRVAAALARSMAAPGLRLQFVKPVETGRQPAETGDADEAAALSEIPGAAAFTLRRFLLPLAPLAAAAEEKKELSLTQLLESWRALPPADLRVVEGAGGIAVPLDNDGHDWTDFARAIQAEQAVLVVPDRLGAINQARLACHYASSRGLRAGVCLNEVQPQGEQIRQSNRQGFLQAGVPLWASLRHGKVDLEGQRLADYFPKPLAR